MTIDAFALAQRLPAPATGISREDSAGSTTKLHALLYNELRAVARRMMRGQPPGQTLQATALVNEAFVHLSRGGQKHWSSREDYLRVAAFTMRNVLVDHARWRKRSAQLPTGSGPDAEGSLLDAIVLEHEDRATDLLALDRALENLARFDPIMARAVELRFFAGLEIEEAAQVLNIGERTLRRHWAAARAWLHKEMEA